MKGKFVTVYVPKELIEIMEKVENKSKLFQQALESVKNG